MQFRQGAEAELQDLREEVEDLRSEVRRLKRKLRELRQLVLGQSDSQGSDPGNLPEHLRDIGKAPILWVHYLISFA